jgi:hypothetical protein
MMKKLMILMAAAMLTAAAPQPSGHFMLSMSYRDVVAKYGPAVRNKHWPESDVSKQGFGSAQCFGPKVPGTGCGFWTIAFVGTRAVAGKRWYHNPRASLLRQIRILPRFEETGDIYGMWSQRQETYYKRWNGMLRLYYRVGRQYVIMTAVEELGEVKVGIPDLRVTSYYIEAVPLERVPDIQASIVEDGGKPLQQKR